MKQYKPVNNNLIGICKRAEAKTTSGILLAQEARQPRREITIIASDSELAKENDVVITDISAGSLIDETDEGVIVAINEDEIIAIVEEK